ncbi:MAG TPA: ester cyclase [Acidimicrobiales bacterium]
MTTASAPAPPEAATNEELIRWAFDVLNTHDVSPVRPMWTSSTVERFPTETCVGADAIAAYFEAAFAALPDFHIEIQTLAASGEDVMVRWHLTGTHSGAPWQGIVPTGKRVALDGIDHFVLRDGNVVSNFVVFDQMQFARAVGLMPPDGSPAERAMKAAFAAKTRLWKRLGR